MTDPASPSSNGLAGAEAARRLSQFGPNAVPEPHDSALARAARRFWEPVPWMLEAAIILQLWLGEYVEASIIAALLIFNVVLSLAQESRADATLAALKSRLALKSIVQRDGVWIDILANALVPGDLVKLSLGGIVPADVRVIDGSVLLDQSMLTGESVPTEAGAGAVAYAGALVRRGGASAEVTATGSRTYFGRAAELVRVAHSQSGAQKAVVGVVVDLAAFNGLVVVLMVGYAVATGVAARELVALALTALLASIPVALPATFTLAAALSAQFLSRRGVLLTRLSAIHDAASVDVLCVDKTGTLTRNELEIGDVAALGADFDKADVLALAALASAESGQDPVDATIRAAAAATPRPQWAVRVVKFQPFDPASKLSEAVVVRPDGAQWRVLKGAPSAVLPVAAATPEAQQRLDALAGAGMRVLAVAAGPPGALQLVGFVGLGDPPRADSAPLLQNLRALGVEVVMVTGDAEATAVAVARKIGLDGPACLRGDIPDQAAPLDFAIYAGVFPEDKFRIVKAFQHRDHVVAMCGDGANDAPALRQAEMGVAVFTATDVAKSAAALVLTEPGLGGVVETIREGRSAFQRVRTYTLNALVKKVEFVLFLALGVVFTGQAILTPMLMALLLITGDFITMSLTTDRATPSPRPDVWRMREIFIAAAAIGLVKLAFSLAVVAVGGRYAGLDGAHLRTLAFVTLAFGSQAVIYAIRERGRLWDSRPGAWLLASSALDIAIASTLSIGGLLMTPLSPYVIGAALVAAIAFAFALDALKSQLFGRLGIA